MKPLIVSFRPFVLAAALVGADCGRPPAAPSREPRFAIELPGPPPSHVLVFDRGGTSSQIPFSSLAEIPASAQSTDAPVTLQLDYSADGDRPRIVTYAIYQAGRKRLGEHRAKLHESVRLTELQPIGYLPLTIRVLPATPPPRPNPGLSSDAPSLRISIVKQNWDSLTLTLHNLSPHPVTAFSLGQVKTPRDDSYNIIGGTAARPAIPSGGAVTVEHFEGGPIVVRCALFDDGSWEGDPAIIASMKAGQAATEALLRQINEVAARILSDLSLDDGARIAAIRRAIDALPETPAPALLRKALEGLPVHRLSDAEFQTLESNLHHIKLNQTASLSQFDPQRGATLAQFWAATHR